MFCPVRDIRSVAKWILHVPRAVGTECYYVRARLSEVEKINSTITLALLPHNFVENTHRSLGYACVFRLIMKQNT